MQTIEDKLNKVGIIGLGKMGSAIAGRLLSIGIKPVVFNRNIEHTTAMVKLGALIAVSPAEVASLSDIVFTVVTGCEDVKSVILGSQGVWAGAKSGMVVIDISTIDPECSMSIASELRKRSVHMLDAPVTGSVHDAKQGTLGFLVGGDIQVLKSVYDLLMKIGKHIFHFGPNGTGCSAKLALNLLLGAMIQSLSESMAFLQVQGLSRRLFLEAVAASGLSSPLFERAGQRALSNDYEARFAVKDLFKDISLLSMVSEKAGLDLSLLRHLHKLLERRMKEYGMLDYSSLIAAEEKSIHSL